MRIYQNKQALTLVELLIAISVVGIIMTGIVSAEFAMRKYRINAGTGVAAAMNAQALVNHIINTASQAVGKSTDKGIRIGSVVWDTYAGGASDTVAPGGGLGSLSNDTLCIRVPTNSGNTLTLISPTQNVCYTLANTGIVSTCIAPALGSCIATSTGYMELATVQAASGLKAKFVTNNAVGQSQMLFSVTVTVPDASVHRRVPHYQGQRYA